MEQKSSVHNVITEKVVLTMESPPEIWVWRFRSKQAVVFRHIYARDVHCDIIMGHDVVIGTYHDVTMQTDVARMLIGMY